MSSGPSSGAKGSADAFSADAMPKPRLLPRSLTRLPFTSSIRSYIYNEGGVGEMLGLGVIVTLSVTLGLGVAVKVRVRVRVPDTVTLKVEVSVGVTVGDGLAVEVRVS